MNDKAFPTSNGRVSDERLAALIQYGAPGGLAPHDFGRIVRELQERRAVETFSAQDAFNAGVTQAKYRFHYKAALERIHELVGSQRDLQRSDIVRICEEALESSPEETAAHDPTLGPPPRPKVPSAEHWPSPLKASELASEEGTIGYPPCFFCGNSIEAHRDGGRGHPWREGRSVTERDRQKAAIYFRQPLNGNEHQPGEER